MKGEPKKIDIQFELCQAVLIKELGRPGRVKSIWVSVTGVQYEVGYFNNGEKKEAYFFAADLAERKEEN